MRLEWTAESWPYRRPFRTSGLTEEALEVVVATVYNDRGHCGRGEAAGVYYEGETVATMMEQLEEAAPAVASGLTRVELQRLLPAGGARNAIDCALWDLEAKSSGVSVWSRLGLMPPRPVTTCLTLGIDTLQATERVARAAQGMPLIKIKVDGRQHIERVQCVRAACPDAAILVDPNQAWCLELLNELSGPLQRLGVVLIEQPLPRTADAELAGYTGAVPLAADESCSGLSCLASLSRRFRFVNIKLDKTGGLTEALALAKAARTVGYALMVGCMAGTSLAMAPGMVVAQFAQIVDLDGPLLHASDRVPGIDYRRGVMQVPGPDVWG